MVISLSLWLLSCGPSNAFLRNDHFKEQSRLLGLLDIVVDVDVDVEFVFFSTSVCVGP